MEIRDVDPNVWHKKFEMNPNSFADSVARAFRDFFEFVKESNYVEALQGIQEKQFQLPPVWLYLGFLTNKASVLSEISKTSRLNFWTT